MIGSPGAGRKRTPPNAQAGLANVSGRPPAAPCGSTRTVGSRGPQRRPLDPRASAAHVSRHSLTSLHVRCRVAGDGVRRKPGSVGKVRERGAIHNPGRPRPRLQTRRISRRPPDTRRRERWSWSDAIACLRQAGDHDHEQAQVCRAPEQRKRKGRQGRAGQSFPSTQPRARRPLAQSGHAGPPKRIR